MKRYRFRRITRFIYGTLSVERYVPDASDFFDIFSFFSNKSYTSA